VTLLNVTLYSLEKVAIYNMVLGRGRTQVDSGRSVCALPRALVPEGQVIGWELHKSRHLLSRVLYFPEPKTGLVDKRK
jgi:hypothetical protein